MTVPRCAGCLDSRECWICSGTGVLDTAVGVEACTSCLGTRACAYCPPAQVIDLPTARADAV